MDVANNAEKIQNEMAGDRRAWRRYNLDLPIWVEVQAAGRHKTKLRYRLHNISADGVFIKTKYAFPVGTIVRAEIDLHFSGIYCSDVSLLYGDCIITATGWVSHIRDDGMVIRFSRNFSLVEIPASANEVILQ